MAQPLKNIYDPPFLAQFGERVRQSYGAFDSDGFAAAAIAEPWPSLELKGRMRRITETLGAFLPAAYEDALEILSAVAPDCRGFAYLFFPDFVEVFGQDPAHRTLSMEALASFTVMSSSEFAVRPFLLAEPERMMEQMLAWTGHPDEHVRRLASEGCRPRLPWGQALPPFKRDPRPVLRVLERLKADPSLYVRKSVANNLNDIAKDNPAVVLETAARWKGTHPHTDWIVRHGCRTLIRKADPEALALFGYSAADGEETLDVHSELSARPSELPIGGACELRYELRLREGGPVRLRIEYGIDFVKANGRTSRKLFLWSDKTVPGGSMLSGIRRHDWSDLTTRRHYPGLHRIVLVVNGRETASTQLSVSAAADGSHWIGGANARMEVDPS